MASESLSRMQLLPPLLASNNGVIHQAYAKAEQGRAPAQAWPAERLRSRRGRASTSRFVSSDSGKKGSM
jgi:hypothetical protein